MRIDGGSIDLHIKDTGIRDIAPPADKPAAGASFAATLGDAVGSLEKMQTAADKEVDAVAMGGGNLHEMALALEKADIGMRLAMKVRNKLVEAYQEIMRMGV